MMMSPTFDVAVSSVEKKTDINSSKEISSWQRTGVYLYSETLV